MSTSSMAPAPLVSLRAHAARRWFLDQQTWIRVTTEQSGGSVAVVEHLIPAAAASPWHLHHLQDESIYVLEATAPCSSARTTGPSAQVTTPSGHARLPTACASRRARGQVLVICTPGAGDDRLVQEAASRRPPRALRLPTDRHGQAGSAGGCRRPPGPGPLAPAPGLRTSLATSTRPPVRGQGASVTMTIKAVHHLAHQRERPDGGVEWACLQCGHYVVRQDYRQVVILQGAPNTIHVPRFPPTPEEVQSLSEFDQDFLRSHTMAW
jgi:hypothetical protein